MSNDIKVWMVITDQTTEGGRDIGLVLKVDEERDRYHWLPLPQQQGQALTQTADGAEPETGDQPTDPRPQAKVGRVKHHICAPKEDCLSDLQRRVDEQSVTLRMRAPEGLQAIPLVDLEKQAMAERTPRAKAIGAALRVMKEQWKWIEAYAKRAEDVDDYLDKDAVNAYARLAATTHGVEYRRIVRAIRAYLMGGLEKSGLLPVWGRCGAPGEERVAADNEGENDTARVGRENIGTRRGVAGQVAVAATEDVRQKLRQGYRKFKKKRVSVEQAFAMTLGEFWAEKVDITGRRRQVKLLPTNELPTLAQFQRHGPGRDPKRLAVRINVGEHQWLLKHRPLQGNERTWLRAAQQGAEIDATSDDQKLVMGIDRTVAMPSSWNTKVRETFTGYIASMYSGFERPSTLTSLIAIALAADDKVEFCARYGVTIEPDDWMALNFRRIRADNGELKSEAGIKTMAAAEISAEFVKAYSGDRKGGVESSHFQLQVGATHQLPGSTMGEIRRRGERDPEKDRCLTHSEYMYHAIRWILWHNNVQHVPHLLTIDMRRDKVKPTRAEILRWLIKNHYVATTAPNQEQLRPACLPRIQGTLQRDGIRLFDPGSKGKRYIPGLLYKSAALEEFQKQRADRNLIKDVTVHINPSDIGKVWLYQGGLIQVDLHTHDPNLSKLSLRECLLIADDDRLKEFLSKPLRYTVMSNDGLERYDSEKTAKAAKKAAEVAAASAGKKPGKKPSKKEAAKLEAEAALNRALGTSKAEVSNEASKWFDLAPPQEDDDEPDWVRQIRQSTSN